LHLDIAQKPFILTSAYKTYYTIPAYI